MLRLASFAASLSSPLGASYGTRSSPSDIALVGDPSGEVQPVEQSGGVQYGHVMHGPQSEAHTRHPSGRTRIWTFIPVVLCSPRAQCAVIPPAPAGK